MYESTLISRPLYSVWPHFNRIMTSSFILRRNRVSVVASRKIRVKLHPSCDFDGGFEVAHRAAIDPVDRCDVQGLQHRPRIHRDKLLQLAL